jgi:hypothetical protein
LGRLAFQDIAEGKQMTESIALIRKEYRELRWFLLAGLIFFIGFPLPFVLSNLSRHPSVMQAELFEGLVLTFGGLYAFLVAIAGLCHDLRGNTFYFWSSRPIGLKHFCLVKYLTGLSIVLCVCTLPLLLNFLLYQLNNATGQIYNTHTFNLLSCHSFTVILMFSVTFLISVFMRQAANTALLSLCAGLIIYFLPTLFSSLESLSVFYHLSEGVFADARSSMHGATAILLLSQAYKQFVLVMLTLSLACLVVSWLAIEREWRLTMNKQLISWCLGLVVLILAGSCAFQLGSNMNCERQISIPPGKQGMQQGVFRIAASQNAGALLLYDFKPNWISAEVNYSMCTFDLGAPDPVMGPRHTTHVGRWPSYRAPLDDKLVWSPQNPFRAYLIPRHKQPEAADTGAAPIPDTELWTLALDAADANAIRHKLKLNDPATEPNPNSSTPLYLRGNALYAYVDHRLLCIDASDADSPIVTQTVPVKRFGINLNRNRIYKGLRTLPLPDLSDGERFDISFHLAPGNDKLAYVDDVLVAATRQGIRTYRLVDMDKEFVRFEPLGQVRVSPLQRLAGFYARQVMLHGDVAYVLNFDTGVGGGMLAFDIRRPERPRQVGHYVTPKERFFAMAPLPGGNILLGGNNLHVIHPPKR